MSRNYGRAYRLAILRQGETQYFTDRHVKFRVQKFAGGVNNVAQIDVFNLPEQERNRLARPLPNVDTAIVQPKITVFLHAGYGSDLALLSRGVAQVAYSQRQPTNWLTRFVTYTTLEQDYNTKLQKSWINTKAITIIRELFDKYQYPNPRFSINAEVMLQEVLPDHAVSGSVKRSIDNLLAKYRLIYSIDEEGPKIAVRGDAFDEEKPQNTLPLISERTGMIGSPAINITGVSVRAMLSSQVASLYPLRSFVLESETTRQTFQRFSIFEGAPPTRFRQRFTVRQADYVGDNRSGDWYGEFTGMYPGYSYQGEDIAAEPRESVR